MRALKENSLMLEIEIKRQEMYKSAMENGISNPITIKISQELDELLNSLTPLANKIIKRGN